MSLRCALFAFIATFVSFSFLQAQERPQIRWQRSLEDALTISKAEKRPLLVAVNLDGESASDRIVVERYRDPKFVAWTNRFVCVIGHPFRHNVRDYDEKGRRIPCPRLGEITCGEHQALEPILFDKYLGGERVSPRHALIQVDGAKTFDLMYLFDLRDLDRALEENAAKAPPPSEPPVLAAAEWSKLASGRDARIREQLEAAVAALPPGDPAKAALAAIAHYGDAGGVDALRILLARETWHQDAITELGKTAAALGVEATLASGVRDRLATAGSFPGAPGLGEDRRFLALLAMLDGKNPASRLPLLARFALAEPADRAAAREALAKISPPEDLAGWEKTVKEEGGACNLLRFFDRAERPSSPSGAAPAALDAIPPIEEIERDLESADQALGKNPEDVAAMVKLGVASLQLARVRIERGIKGAEFLLEDASQWLARAASARPGDFAIGVARARTAYFQGRFEEQERLAFELAGQVKAEDERVEALRWAGDAAARLLGSRAGGEATGLLREILRGMHALTLVCASAESAEIDWTSLASFFAALGCPREELAVLQAGAQRIPESPVLRDSLNAALWRAGRIDLAPRKAEWIASRNPASAACAYFAGYAWMLAAEDLRRAEKAEEAIAAYRNAESQLRRTRSLDAKEKERAAHFLGMCALGRGFAALIEGRQQEAAEALLEALAIAPSAADSRDGLDREAVDLLDGALEWREGRASPVDFSELSARFQRQGLGPRWQMALADTGLREALRADGRSERGHRAPTEEGDRYLEASIAAARRAVGLEKSEATRHTLAQSLCVHAERMLERDRAGEAGTLLFEVAAILGEEPPAKGATQEDLTKIARSLRAKLGPARPVFRPGR